MLEVVIACDANKPYIFFIRANAYNEKFLRLKTYRASMKRNKTS